MKVWIDLANSPHVQIFEPVIQRLRSEGHEVLLTARDHAQTVDLARRRWPEVWVIGGPSPTAVLAKGHAIVRRVGALRRIAVSERLDVALSHGSYAQIVAAQVARVPAVTMMDYEHQPASHLSFRLAQRVVVPGIFPDGALRRFGARPGKIVRFPGIKEELYLDGFKPDQTVLEELGLLREQVIAVFRPPPEGALYHRTASQRFEEVLHLALGHTGLQIVLLPRSPEQSARYRALSDRIRIPPRAIDAPSLLALADLTVGGGGTMTRESVILGTPTYTAFGGRLAAVDAELIRAGRLLDLRLSGSRPRFEKKSRNHREPTADSEPILAAILESLEAVRRTLPRPSSGRCGESANARTVPPKRDGRQSGSAGRTR